MNQLSKKNKVILYIVSISVFVILIVPLFVTVVNTGQVGVVNTFGEVSDNFLKPGLVLKNPFSTISYMSTRTESYTFSSLNTEGQVSGDDSIEVRSQDGAVVKLELTVLYRLPAENAPRVVRELGIEYESKIIRPTITGTIRDIISKYSVVDIYANARTEVENKLREALESELENKGFSLDDLLIKKISLSDELTQSIEQKLSALQKKDAQKLISETLTDEYLEYLYIQSLKDNSNTIYVPTEGGIPLFRNLNP